MLHGRSLDSLALAHQSQNAGRLRLGVGQAKISGTVRPGETLTVRAEVAGRLGRLVQARASVRAGGA